MVKQIVIALRRALHDAAERRNPNIRRIDGVPYAYCAIRRQWVKVRFHGEK